MTPILLIDAEARLRDLLRAYFERFDLELISATHPVKGLELLAASAPELVILDVMLPEDRAMVVDFEDQVMLLPELLQCGL